MLAVRRGGEAVSVGGGREWDGGREEDGGGGRGAYEVGDVGVALRVELDAFFLGAVAEYEAHGFRDGYFSWERAAAAAVAGGHGG